MNQRAPALFVGHGSPMNAIEDTPSARGWAEIAARFPKPRAIVCVSAHWVTDGVRVTANAQPRTIHDFGCGFPQALFDVQYPAPGDPALAQRIVEKLTAFDAQLDDTWGLDHGTWSVVKHMYPDADVPIVQVSLDRRASHARHFGTGLALADLRDDNVLLLASGNIVHNLRAFFSGDARSGGSEAEFEAYIVDALVRHDFLAIQDYNLHPHAPGSAPDWDHFMPVLYAVAAGTDDDAKIFNKASEPGISMTSIAYGLPQ